MWTEIFSNMWKIGLVHFAVILTPGPNFFLTIIFSITRSLKHGILVALGTTAGTVVYLSASVFGLNVFLHNYPQGYAILKIMGCLYLGFVGAKTIVSAKKFKFSNDLHRLEHSAEKSTNAFKIGLVTTVLNPKAAIYLLGLMSVILKFHDDKGLAAIYVSEIILITFVWFSLIALMFSKALVRDFFGKHSRLILTILGSYLVVLAVVILVKTK